MLDVRLGDDDMRVRFGIRQVAAVGQQIHINGQPIRLLGCNRHEFHPNFGHTLPDATLVSDIQQLKDMGCNFVRGSHYPQDERFLDLCDEFGICVWSESIGWQHDEAHLTDERFVEAQLTHTEEMVAATVNHASVILWGILNESASHKETCQPAYTRLLAQLKALDASRPVTYASNHPFDDVCLLLADVISINTYPGWYIGSIEGIPTHLDEIVAHLDSAGCENKPLIISEIGAGAVPGWRDAHGERWTEQYQTALLDVVIKHLFVHRERFAGLVFWLFSDFRTPSQVPNILTRPRGFNNKGVLDEYRRPKQAYHMVKTAFNQLNKT
jgi:beta-glucuronidase